MIDYGLRTEGGTGPLFKRPNFEGNKNNFFSVFFFGTCFFLLILIVSAIVLSIVIHSFDELKEKALFL